MIRSRHENRKPFAPAFLKIQTHQHRCNKFAFRAKAECRRCADKFPLECRITATTSRTDLARDTAILLESARAETALPVPAPVAQQAEKAPRFLGN
jgi:hypothetical protein